MNRKYAERSRPDLPEVQVNKQRREGLPLGPCSPSWGGLSLPLCGSGFLTLAWRTSQPQKHQKGCSLARMLQRRLWRLTSATGNKICVCIKGIPLLSAKDVSKSFLNQSPKRQNCIFSISELGGMSTSPLIRASGS